MTDDLTAHLNDAQRQAVTAPLDHCLVLAGAGSGKTRVLVHRMAWLMKHHHVSPWGILAVTFTNKAAAEMRHRVEALLGMPAQGMWIGTFHGLAHRLLRAHWEAAGLVEQFQIIDSDEQYRMIKRLQKAMELDEERWPPKKTQWYINHKKEQGLRAKHIQPDGQLYTETMIKIYTAYEVLCERGGLVDFSDLLLRAHELWLHHPELLAHYRERFSHILVDEFQDTNALQYAWVRLLAGSTGKVMAVGDDDQSIYSWRGAEVENIRRFQEDFKGAMMVRLEQNYRSTQSILDAANAVIANNTDRMGKQLWSGGDRGHPVGVYEAYSEQDEAQFMVTRSLQWTQSGGNLRDIAVLYRSNAQSRVLEEALLRAGIQYRVYGGQKFFERAEIKDVLAYCRLMTNHHDDSSFERIANVPTRGVGQTSMAVLREWARLNQCSLWTAVESLSQIEGLSPRAKNAMQQFVLLITEMGNACVDAALADQLNAVIEKSGLIAHHQKDRSERGLSRLENIEELVNAAKEFIPDPDENLPPMSAFLASAALEAGEGQAEAYSDCMQLMTLHSAKGLEFPLVFIVGVEEQLFPHQMSLDEPGRLEEERRLCYVGMTRAMKQLYLCYAQKRRLHGREHYHRPSRFLEEIPESLVEHVRPKAQVQWRQPKRSAYTPSSTLSSGIDFDDDAEALNATMRPGQRVRHGRFGDGVICASDGYGDTARVQVRFDEHGAKWLLLSVAKLEVMEAFD